jgi:hypothetical protein
MKKATPQLMCWLGESHGGVPEGWAVRGHHCTVDMKPATKSIGSAFVGQTVELKVVRLGRLEGIMAVEVETVVPSKNSRKHVTLCYNEAGGWKPKQSNDIEMWMDVEPFVLAGVVQEVQ